MMRKVSIQVSGGLVCCGQAIVEKDGEQRHILFDVVKYPLQVVINDRKTLNKEGNDVVAYEEELLQLLIKHGVPQKLGIVPQVVIHKKRGPKGKVAI